MLVGPASILRGWAAVGRHHGQPGRQNLLMRWTELSASDCNFTMVWPGLLANICCNINIISSGGKK
jgi:hypothetical protein